jgi:hypothetical protein
MSKEFWDEFNSLLIQPTTVELEYRLHYNDAGEIYLGTTHDHPTDTQYVVVSQTEYNRYFDYRVVDGNLKKIEHNAGYRVKLYKSTSGTPVVAGHAGLVVEPTEEYTDIEYYDYRNS